ncbi:DUF4097 family beta strand repeat-containing protein [Enterococcus timonensis]|uniref:DUF4097 family beta strand repeat-containing protein n=1 Tax=Enterococcus timonensis TaxID=1852364 RepID=UPI0008DA92A4|nr:DUF4097 family beta strand repeat-containing protein [Enterococcus timonensis]
MKKSSLALLIVSMIFIVVGALIAAFTFTGAKEDVTTVYAESFPLKSDTLTIDVNTKFYYQLVAGSSDEVKVSASYLDLGQTTLSADLKNDQLTVATATNDTAEKALNTINDGVIQQQEFTIEIPASVKHLHLIGSNGYVSDLSLESLDVSSYNEVINLYNLTVDEFSTSGDESNVSLQNSVIKSLNANAKSGFLELSSVKVDQGTVTGDNLNLNLQNVSTKKIATTLTKGDITLGNYTGEFSLDGQSVGVNLSDGIMGNLDLTVTHGSIYGNFNEKPTETKIVAKSDAGQISLFDQKEFGNSETKYLWQLNTTLGDINLDSYGGYYDEAFDDDYDEANDDDYHEDYDDDENTVQESVDENQSQSSAITESSNE